MNVNTIFGAERDARFEDDRDFIGDLKVKMLKEDREDDLTFEMGEVIADTLPLTETKWEVHKTRAGDLLSGFNTFRCPALRVEGLGVLPKVGVTVGHVLTQEDEAIRWDMVS